jgi:hypothetical protein
MEKMLDFHSPNTKSYMVRHDAFLYFYKKYILMLGNMIYLLTVSLTESQQFLSNTQRTTTIFEMYHIPTTFSLLIFSPVPSPHTTYSSLCSSLGQTSMNNIKLYLDNMWLIFFRSMINSLWNILEWTKRIVQIEVCHSIETSLLLLFLLFNCLYCSPNCPMQIDNPIFFLFICGLRIGSLYQLTRHRQHLWLKYFTA